MCSSDLAFFQQCQLFAYPIHFRRQLSRPLPLALVLAVPGQDVLLAPNEVIGGNRLGGGLGVAGQLLGVLGKQNLKIGLH